MDNRVDDGCLDVGLVDLLSSMMMLDTLSLPLNNWLHFFNAVMVYSQRSNRSSTRPSIGGEGQGGSGEGEREGRCRQRDSMA